MLLKPNIFELVGTIFDIEVMSQYEVGSNRPILDDESRIIGFVNSTEKEYD